VPLALPVLAVVLKLEGTARRANAISAQGGGLRALALPWAMLWQAFGLLWNTADFFGVMRKSGEFTLRTTATTSCGQNERKR